MAAWIREQAPLMLGLGQHRTLTGWLKALPLERVDADPWLLFWLGSSLEPYKPMTAKPLLEKALALFEQAEDTSGWLLAWAGVVQTIFKHYATYHAFDPWFAMLAEPGVDAQTRGGFGAAACRLAGCDRRVLCHQSAQPMAS